MWKKIILTLVIILVLFGLVSARAPGCVASPVAGRAEFVIEGGQEIVMMTFSPAFCKPPVVVATGDEAVEQVQIGVVTATSVTFVVTGQDGTARVYWHALPGE